jgi:maltooligosyltrehalose trehalohydrolase
MKSLFTDPGDPGLFKESILDFSERQRHQPIYMLHRDLLKLRREEPVFNAQQHRGLDGAVLGREALVLRFFGENRDDRLLVVNFGVDLHLDPSPEPLLAPLESMQWKIIWSSENPKYGGSGTPQMDSINNWYLPGHAAVVLGPRKAGEAWS